MSQTGEMLKMHKLKNCNFNISPEMLKMHKMYKFPGKVRRTKKETCTSCASLTFPGLKHIKKKCA